jgi:uncharacterized protein (TIGR03067 family)
MTRLIQTFAALLLTSLAAQSADANLKELNGVWLPDHATLGGKEMPKEVLKTIKLELADGKYTTTTADGQDKGDFKVDAAANPKSMDIEGTDGPNKGKKFPCIYKLNGDELTICYDLSGKSRPAEFKSEAKTLQYLVVYRRQK